LWNWSVDETLSLETFLNNKEIVSEDLFVRAVENFEEFLTLTFGKCWEGCTGEFRKKLKTNEDVSVLSYMYLKHGFIKTLILTFSSLSISYLKLKTLKSRICLNIET
jgi:hypothetical protein